jgi:hypothetical protein
VEQAYIHFDMVLPCNDLNGVRGTLVVIDWKQSSIIESYKILSHEASRATQSLVRFFV